MTPLASTCQIDLRMKRFEILSFLMDNMICTSSCADHNLIQTALDVRFIVDDGRSSFLRPLFVPLKPPLHVRKNFAQDLQGLILLFLPFGAALAAAAAEMFSLLALFFRSASPAQSRLSFLLFLFFSLSYFARLSRARVLWEQE